MCCDGERAKTAKREAERAAKHAARSPDEIRESLRTLYAIRDGDSRGNLGAAIVLGMGGGSIDKAAVDAEVAKEEALLDAEYHKAFPNGPVPIFSARLDNPGDVAALRHAFHADALTKAFGEGGGGMAEIERLVAEARIMQSRANEGSERT